MISLKPDKTGVLYILYCYDCDIEFIWSKLPDGVNRYICGTCGKKYYISDFGVLNEVFKLWY